MAGTGGAAGGVTVGCTSPYADQLAVAVTAALPASFTWQDLATCGPGGDCLRCTVCQASPCGSCSLTWSSVNATPDGTKAYADVTAECADIKAKWTCGSDTPGTCGVTMDGTGTVEFEVGPGAAQGGAVSWPAPKVTALIDWAASTTCGAFSATDVGDDLNAEAVKAMGMLGLSAACK